MNKKTLFTIIVLIAVVMISLTMRLGNNTQTTTESVSDYTMPRPKAYQARFDLSGRNIERELLNPFAVKKEAQDKTTTAKTAEAKKEVTKKQAKNKKAKSKKEAKAKLEVTVIEKEESSFKKSTDDKDSNSVVYFAPINKQQPTGATDANNKDKKEEPKVDYANLLKQSPNAENLQKLVTAFRQGEVSANVFYTIASDLLVNEKSDVRALGIKALELTPSTTSFSYLAWASEQLPNEQQAYVHQTLNLYSSPSYLPIITQLLHSKEKVVLLRATEVIITSVNNYNASQSPNVKDGLYRQRSIAALPQYVGQYNEMLPLLEELANDSEPEIAESAQVALAQVDQIIKTKDLASL